MELSEFLMRDSRQAVEKFHDFSMTFLNFHDFIFLAHFPWLSMTRFCPCFSMTVGTLHTKCHCRYHRHTKCHRRQSCRHKSVTAGSPVVIQSVTADSPVVIQSVTADSSVAIQIVTAGSPVIIQSVIKDSPVVIQIVTAGSHVIRQSVTAGSPVQRLS